MVSMRAVEEPVEGELITDVVEELEKRRSRRAEEGEAPHRAGGPERVEEVKVGKLLEEAELLTEGKCFEGVIREIYIGRYGDFVSPPRDERFLESYERRKERMAYCIYFDTPYGRFRDVIVISAHANSRMVRLARCYSKFRVGMKVKVCIENGRPKISC